jgi:hypothetical protein
VATDVFLTLYGVGGASAHHPNKGTQVHVVGFHQKMTSTAGSKHAGGTTHGGLLDTVALTYESLEFESLDSGKQATYTVQPPP